MSSINVLDYKPSDFGIIQHMERHNSYGLVGGGVRFDWAVEVSDKIVASGSSQSQHDAHLQLKAAAIAAAQEIADSGWW